MAKNKGISFFSSRRRHTILGIIKQAIDDKKIPLITTQSQFIEMLIKNFAYQILKENKTFVREQNTLKKALEKAKLNKYTFRAIESQTEYQIIESAKEIEEKEKQINKINEYMNEIRTAIDKLESKKTRLENEIDVLQQQKNEFGMSATNDVKTPKFKDENRNKKDTKPKAKSRKYEPVTVDFVRLTKDDETLTDIDVEVFEKFIFEREKNEDKAKEYLKATRYKNKDEQLQIMPNVYIILKEIAQAVTKKDVLLAQNLKDFEENHQIGETKSGKSAVIIDVIENQYKAKAQAIIKQKQQELQEKQRQKEEQEQEKQQEKQNIENENNEEYEDEIFQIAFENNEPKINANECYLFYNVQIFNEKDELKEEIERRYDTIQDTTNIDEKTIKNVLYIESQNLFGEENGKLLEENFGEENIAELINEFKMKWLNNEIPIIEFIG